MSVFFEGLGYLVAIVAVGNLALGAVDYTMEHYFRVKRLHSAFWDFLHWRKHEGKE